LIRYVCRLVAFLLLLHFIVIAVVTLSNTMIWAKSGEEQAERTDLLLRLMLFLRS
jgi:hypothetical protein